MIPAEGRTRHRGAWHRRRQILCAVVFLGPTGSVDKGGLEKSTQTALVFLPSTPWSRAMGMDIHQINRPRATVKRDGAPDNFGSHITLAPGNRVSLTIEPVTSSQQNFQDHSFLQVMC